MKGPKDKSAAAQTYYGLLRFSRMFLAVAGIDLAKGHLSLAQSNIDLSQRLLDLTPRLYQLLEPGTQDPSPHTWGKWKEDLAEAIEFAGFGKDPVHAKARTFLSYVQDVQWGDHDAMLKGRLAPGAALGRGGAL